MNGQQLKNSILQMAVQGKLVPQDPNDEPASVLIQRIREEKEKLIKEKKIKKEKNPSYIFRGSDNLHYEKLGDAEAVCIEEQIPFEIPNSWEWGRISLISYLVGNKNNQIQTKSISVEGCIPVVSQGNKLIDGYSDAVEKKIQDLPLVMFGDHTRNVKYVDFPFVIGADGTKFHKILVCNPKYIYYWMYLSASKLKNRGYARHYSLLDQLFIPLPPLSEQERIVAKIETLLPHIDEYNTKASELLVLNDSFPEKLKKSILQEAVRGKLVPQDPSEEPASALLERIHEEKARLVKEGKIKKDKNESVIFRRDNSYYEKIRDAGPVCIEEQLPFDIPDSWQWVRLKDIVSKEVKRGKSPKYADYGEHYVFAQKCNVKTGGINMSLAKYLSDDVFQKYPTDEYMQDNDIIVNSTGNGTLGRIGIFHDSDRVSNGEIVPDSHVTVIRTVAEVNASFVYYTLKYYQPFLEKQGDGSTNQTELKPVTIASLLIPLPPVTEQNRIVYKIESLLHLCGKLK